MLPQRYRSELFDDDVSSTADSAQPMTELLGITYGGGKSCHRDTFGQVDEHFLPHRTTGSIGQVVHLVHDHVGEVVQ